MAQKSWQGNIKGCAESLFAMMVNKMAQYWQPSRGHCRMFDQSYFSGGSLVPSFLVLKYVRVLHLQVAACERLDLTGIHGMFLLRFLKVVCSTTGEYVKLPDQIGEL